MRQRKIGFPVRLAVSVVLACALVLSLSAETSGGRAVGRVPRGIGRLRLAPDTAVTAVATLHDPTEREMLAVEELRSYLERMSGSWLEHIRLDGDTVPIGFIAVGRLAEKAGLVTREELDAVASDGYVVKAEKGRIAVCGHRDLGTVYGAYALLRHLGARFYTKECEIVPESRDLVIPACVLTAKPFFEFRKLDPFPRGYKMSYDPLGDFYNLKLGCTPIDDIGSPRQIGYMKSYSLGHTAVYLLPFEKYGESHPEYFALLNGKRGGSHAHGDMGAPICFSSETGRETLTERLLVLIGKQKDRKFFCVMQNDGALLCECEGCKTPMPPTDRLLTYINAVAREVAKHYPEKRILTLGYTTFSAPPVKVLPEPNVWVLYCAYTPRANCQSHDLSCERNGVALKDLDGWIAKCPGNVGVYDYPKGYASTYEPFGSFYAMKRKLERYADLGVRGLFYCGVPSNFRELFLFVQSRMLWEPKTTDVEALVGEFMAAYYGKAAPHMRAYFNFLNDEVDKRQIHQMCEKGNPELVTAAYAETAFGMFRKAEEAVADDPVALARVRREKLCVLFADLNVRNRVAGNLAVDEGGFACRVADLLSIARDLGVRMIDRYRYGSREDDVLLWLERVSGVKLTVKPWYDDPLVGTLIADPKTVLSVELKKKVLGEKDKK